MKHQTTTKQPFYKKPAFLWTIGLVLGLIVLVMAVFRISPVPGALIIRADFDKGSAKVLQALEKHVPQTPVSVLANQQYRVNDPDALLDVYIPADAAKTKPKLPTIIWTHGGAWLSGSKDNAAPYYKLLAAEGFTVIALNYSLAPERQYPAALFQLNEAHDYILKNAAQFHVDTNNLVLAGDSAGSQLSSQLAALITNISYAKELNISTSLRPEQLRGVILNCGIYKMHELTVPDPTLPKLIGWGTDVSVWAYAGTRDFSSPIIRQMSPYYYVNSDFPATYITGGNGDPLTNVQSKPFADKLMSLGVKVDRLFYADNQQPSLPHEYQFNLDTADGQTAFKRSVDFARSVTKQ